MKLQLPVLLLVALVLAAGCLSPQTPLQTTGGGAAAPAPSPSPQGTQAVQETGTRPPEPAGTPAAPAGACPAGQAECSGVCVDLLTDWYHCGSCDASCAAAQTCSAGTCTGSPAPACPEGQTTCGGTCTDTRYDPNNCGSCGTVCPAGQGCVDSACTGTPGPSCPSSQLMCSGACVNYLTDSTNCGSCGHTCFTGSSCKAGSCQCPSPETACTKPVTLAPIGRTLKPVPACVNLNTDRENCGSCNHLCGVKETCCAGHCVNLNIDPFNCGSCKKRCPQPLDPPGLRYCRLGHCSATPP